MGVEVLAPTRPTQSEQAAVAVCIYKDASFRGFHSRKGRLEKKIAAHHVKCHGRQYATVSAIRAMNGILERSMPEGTVLTDEPYTRPAA